MTLKMSQTMIKSLLYVPMEKSQKPIQSRNKRCPGPNRGRGRGNLAERDDPESPEPDADDSVSKGQVPKVVDDDDVTLQKVPRLKIKLGQPPAASKQGARQRPDGAELTKEDIPPLLLRTTPTSSQRIAKGKVAPQPLEV